MYYMPRSKSIRSVTIEIDDLEWDDENMHHCAANGVNMWDAEAVLRARPRFFPNKESRRGTHMMVGNDAKGRFCTIILRMSARPRAWRPVTAWPSKHQEVDYYRTAKAPL